MTKGLLVYFVSSTQSRGNPGSIIFRTIKCTAGVLGGIKNVDKVEKSGKMKFLTESLIVGIELVFSQNIREFAVISVTEGFGPDVKNFQSKWSPKCRGLASDLLNKNLTAD